jgi:short subunit dehydrogenase
MYTRRVQRQRPAAINPSPPRAKPHDLPILSSAEVDKGRAGLPEGASEATAHPSRLFFNGGPCMTVGEGGRLEGKSAFVTGAGSGIGRATAELFAREGAQVGVADVNGAEASVTVETIRAAGGNAEVYELDVANPAQVKRAIAAFAAATGSIHVLINNAGVVVGGAAGQVDEWWSLSPTMAA